MTPIPPTTEPGIADVAAIMTAMTNQQLCAQGYHAWVPWLHNGTSWFTWCAREHCTHTEQWDD